MKKINDNTMLRVRVPKKLYESIQAELAKKNAAPMQEEEQVVEESVFTDPNFIAGVSALLGVTGAVAAAIMKDLKNAKSKEEKKQVLAQAAQKIGQATTGGM